MFNPTPETVAKVLGSPLQNVKANYPILKQYLAEFGVTSDAGLIVALATVGCEAKSFLPVREAYWLSLEAANKWFMAHYDVSGKNPKLARTLGNVIVGDGKTFCGRGFIQTTGRGNYRALTHILGIDMEKNPDVLLTPVAASKAMGYYLKTHGTVTWAEKSMKAPAPKCSFCPRKLKPGEKQPVLRHITESACKDCCWKKTRKTVNGGLNGYPEFRKIVDSLVTLVQH